jgi:hypothetical protein
MRTNYDVTKKKDSQPDNGCEISFLGGRDFELLYSIFNVHNIMEYGKTK